MKPARVILVLVGLVGVSGLWFTEALPQASADESAVVKKTLTYKTVGEVKIQADVYQSGDQPNRPVVAWFHGGALVMGHRRDVPKQLLEYCQEQGFVLVSFDYRLIPQVKLPEVIEDLKDAVKWIRVEGPELFNADPRKLVVAGGSAGGYLTLMSGFAVEPPPTALVSFWGFGDIDGSWTTTPNKVFLRGDRISDEEAQTLIGDRVLTHADQQTGPDRWKYFVYLKQKGTWCNAATGYDPKTDKDRLTPFCPIRNLSAKYPPLLMVHGTDDVDVPYEKSVEMAAALKERGRPHRLITLEKGRHGGWGGDPNQLTQAIQDTMKFIGTHLQTDQATSEPGQAARPKRTRTYVPRPFQVVSPEVHSDKRITFRLRAPQADVVEVKSLFFKGKHPLTKDERGVWSVTLGPAEPGIQSYTFFVDGLEIPDPANPWIIFSPKHAYNLMEVPADDPLCFERQNVPSGTVHSHSYYSEDLETTRSFLVYTPPGYETSDKDDYPALYLLHGGGNHERSWTNNGRAHIIMDNLLAKGDATPMVIVMPYGHLRSNRRYREYESFQHTLLDEVLPLVEAKYRVSRNQKDRAIAGLSMGGAQSLYVGLCNLDKFDWIGSFSGGIPTSEEMNHVLEDPGRVNDELRLLWVGCGTRDSLIKANQDFIATLTAKQIKHVTHIEDGIHGWVVWRFYLNDFLPLLFK